MRGNIRILVCISVLVGSLSHIRNANAADTLGKTPVKTNAKTDVQVELVDQAGSTLANIQGNNTAAGAGGNVGVLFGNVQSSAPTYSSGNYAMPWIDTAGRQYVTTDAATNLNINIVKIGGSTQSATAPLFTQLTDGTTAYVGVKTGQLPTALGQTTMAASLSVAIASNQSTIPVSQGAPTGATSSRGTAASIASTATGVVTCATGLTVSVPVKLYQVTVTSQSPARCTIRYNNNTAFTNFMDLMNSAATPTVWQPCPAGFCSITAGASGTQAIEANCTNLDTITNDFQCSVQYCNSASGC